MTVIDRSRNDLETLDLGVEGMTCASCVAHVERAIAAVPGVDAVSVNLATERAHVTFAKGDTDLGQIEAAVRQSGYTPVESTIELSISGMTCALSLIHI